MLQVRIHAFMLPIPAFEIAVAFNKIDIFLFFNFQLIMKAYVFLVKKTISFKPLKMIN